MLAIEFEEDDGLELLFPIFEFVLHVEDSVILLYLVRLIVLLRLDLFIYVVFNEQFLL
mgnify:CR=1 FL=1